MTFRGRYFVLMLLLFATEVLIALYVHDKWVRPYFGDLLVVILIYCFARSFFKVGRAAAAVATLLFAFAVEMLQYLSLVERLGLQRNRLASTVIGNSFSIEDLFMYVLGIVVVLLFEFGPRRR